MTDCSLLQPYLTKYQTDNPMLPFLEKDLKSMHLVLFQLGVILMYLRNIVHFLKINLSVTHTRLKVNDGHFWFLLKNSWIIYHIKIKLHLEMLEIWRKRVAICSVSIMKKNHKKVYCISWRLEMRMYLVSDFNDHFRTSWIKNQLEKAFDSHCIIKDS